MLLPKDLLSQNYVKPRLFLCETDKTKMCQLITSETTGTFKLSGYSELSFTVGRTYVDIITGETKVNPFFDKIEALRLVYLEGFGYFEIQDPEVVSDGIKEVKNITAYSLEYTLSQKYLEDFYVNTGETNSIEVIYSDTNGTNLVPVTLYNLAHPELSLLNLILEKIYGWKIGHVDDSLRTLSRTFEISRQSVYDFLMNEICDKFNCYVVFDTIENTINLYASALVTKFIGDGATSSFIISPPYNSIYTVSVDSYKTTAYEYNYLTGELVFDSPPADGAKIEVVDGADEKWTTDVYVTFENLAQEINVSYSADNIKTVLTVKGADDFNIREINNGLPYIIDLSYYYSIDWMGKDLYDAYTKYLKLSNSVQKEYADNAQAMLEIANYITYETQRLSLQYSIAPEVNVNTTGTYYVRGGEAPNYYYIEVTLPADYNANVENYYTLSGNDLNEEKFSDLYEALQVYYMSGDNKTTDDIKKLEEDFEFMETYTIEYLCNALANATSLSGKDNAVKNFLGEMWDQLGSNPLEYLYYEPYKELMTTNIAAGWNNTSNENYWRYYPVTVVLDSLEAEMKERKATITNYQEQYSVLQKENNEISNQLLLTNNFTDAQLIRLNPFLREDEYIDDNFAETESDSISQIIKLKKELLECGKIELSKLCEPKLEFSMNMANIYALDEFRQIAKWFQLGNLINVELRKDYVKRARLLQVNINFDDFSDFSCEFGELLNLRTPSSVHADLLSNAMSAGKSVSSNASYWNKGADLATSTDLKIQHGLLDATSGLYSSNQGVIIDKNGIRLTKVINQQTGEVSPNQAWIINNNILFSSDGFKTSNVGLGEFTVDGQTFYGLLAEAVLSGYIEGSTIKGGTIDIGNGVFTVDSTGRMTSIGGSIAGWEISRSLLMKELIIDDTNYQMYLQAPNGTSSINAFAVRNKATDSDTWDTQFAIAYDGKLTARNANITGSITATNLTLGSDVSIPYSKLSGTPDLDIYISKDGVVGSTPTNGSTGFKVSSDGLLQASNAVIYGTIYSSAGQIAGWDISSSSLLKDINIDGADYQMYLQAPNGSSMQNAFVVRTRESSDSAWDYQFIVNYAGKLTAKNADIAGTITATSGSIAGYNIGEGGTYSNALYKRVSGASADYEVGLKATSGETDLAFYVKESTDNWASSSNTFYVNNSGKLYAKNAFITGEINASSGDISGNLTLSGSLINTNGDYTVTVRGVQDDKSLGVIYIKDESSGTAEYPFVVKGDGSLSATKANISGHITATSGSIGGCSISNGVLNISAANITTGTIDSAHIPNLSATKITAGTLDVDRIPNIDADKITSGTFDGDRISISVGGNIGVWTVNSNGYLYAISGDYGVSLSATSVSHGQGGSAPWASIVLAGQNASDERLKTNISAFEDKFDNIFDNLKPVQFEYSNDNFKKGIHFGYVAQDVIKSFEDEGENINDYSLIYETEMEDNSEEKYYQLNKQDFIALNTWQIQKLKNRITELEDRLAALEA